MMVLSRFCALPEATAAGAPFAAVNNNIDNKKLRA